MTGMNCDTCKEGYEILEASNPFGCSTGIVEIYNLYITLIKITDLISYFYY